MVTLSVRDSGGTVDPLWRSQRKGNCPFPTVVVKHPGRTAMWLSCRGVAVSLVLLYQLLGVIGQ